MYTRKPKQRIEWWERKSDYEYADRLGFSTSKRNGEAKNAQPRSTKRAELFQWQDSDAADFVRREPRQNAMKVSEVCGEWVGYDDEWIEPDPIDAEDYYHRYGKIM